MSKIPNTEMMTVTLQLPVRLAHRLQEVAIAKRLTIGQVVEMALSRFLEREDRKAWARKRSK